jgi:hypothetical protein
MLGWLATGQLGRVVGGQDGCYRCEPWLAVAGEDAVDPVQGSGGVESVVQEVSRPQMAPVEPSR